MTVETTASTITYTGNGATTVFPYTFQIPETSDLYVYVSGNLISPTLYSVTGIGDVNGGNVTYPLTGSPLSATQTITITRTLPFTQTLDLTNQDGFYPETVEDGLDRLEMQIQQINTAEVNTAQDLADAINLFETLINSDTTVTLFATRNAIAAATVGAAVSYIRTAGYATVGDLGAALYKRVVAEPAWAGKVQSADGAWWEIADSVVNVRSVGAKGDNSANDHDALQGAIDSGREVYVPPGLYLTGSALNMLTIGQTLRGAGPYGTQILSTFASGNVVNIGDGTNSVSGARITNITVGKSGATMSGGALIAVRKNCANNYIDHFHLSKGYAGVLVEGGGTSTTVHISDFYIEFCDLSGILLGDTVGVATDTFLSNGTIAACANGLLIIAVSGLYSSNLSILACTNNGVYVNAGTTFPALFMFFTNVLADTCTNYGWLFESAGAFISGIFIDNSWAAANGLSGIRFSTSLLNGAQVQGSNIRANQEHGVLIAAGTNVSVKDNEIFNNSLKTSTVYHGVAVAAGVGDFVVDGNISGQGGYDFQVGGINQQGYGVFVAVGASDRYMIINNRCPANGTGAVSDGGAGVNKTVSNNPAW